MRITSEWVKQNALKNEKTQEFRTFMYMGRELVTRLRQATGYQILIDNNTSHFFKKALEKRGFEVKKDNWEGSIVVRWIK